MHCLHSGNNAIADHYTDWATRVLSTHQLDATDQRCQLAADLMGYPVKTVRKFLSTCCAADIAGIYMCALGTVGGIREKLQFDLECQIAMMCGGWGLGAVPCTLSPWEVVSRFVLPCFKYVDVTDCSSDRLLLQLLLNTTSTHIPALQQSDSALIGRVNVTDNNNMLPFMP
jgi:hypothetical protein